MGIFKRLAEKLGIIEENKTEKIINERTGIKATLAANLKNINFTEEEIDEVLSIITKMEQDVQIQKDRLIGTNINNYTPEIIMKEIFDEIKRIQLQSGEDIRAKIAEINARKQKKQ